MPYYLGRKRGKFKKIFVFVKTYFRARVFLNKKEGPKPLFDVRPYFFMRAMVLVVEKPSRRGRVTALPP